MHELLKEYQHKDIQRWAQRYSRLHVHTWLHCSHCIRAGQNAGFGTGRVPRESLEWQPIQDGWRRTNTMSLWW